MTQEQLLGRVGAKQLLGQIWVFKFGQRIGPDLGGKFGPRTALGQDLGFKFGPDLGVKFGPGTSLQQLLGRIWVSRLA